MSTIATTTIEARSSFSIATLSGNSFINAAQQKTTELSRSILTAFSAAVEKVEDIKPIFLAAAKGFRAVMDKLATKKSEQGLPWAVAGMTNGGENRHLKLRRRAWRHQNQRPTFA